jgi:GNAT superfamily N-acetyltransferase
MSDMWEDLQLSRILLYLNGPDKVGGGIRELTESQSRTLQAQQYSEFRKRYSGSSPFSSQMMLCKDAQKNNAIIGCAGVEIDTVAIFAERQPSPSLWSILGNSIPAKPTGRWETKLKYAPLMSNLVVSRQYRRKGIAEKLVASVEDQCQEWGHDECYLYVEKRNVPAVKLYQKLGYKTLWQDDKAKTLIPTPKGGLESSDTVLICMKKELTGRNRGGRKLLPFLPF